MIEKKNYLQGQNGQWFVWLSISDLFQNIIVSRFGGKEKLTEEFNIKVNTPAKLR